MTLSILKEYNSYHQGERLVTLFKFFHVIIAFFFSFYHIYAHVTTYSAGFKVASFIRTDVKDYKDNIALFQFAEKEFGGVDVSVLLL